MRHRHLSNPFMRPGVDQHGNNHTPAAEQTYFPTGRVVGPENGPFVGHMARGGVHSGSHHQGRPNEYPSSNVSMEIQPYAPIVSHSSSITEHRSLPPVTPTGHIHSTTNYNVPTMHDVESDMSNRPTVNVGSLKRKRSSGISSGSSSYSAAAGSSSSSSQTPMEKPPIDPYRSNLTIDGEDSSRNVRRRYRLDLEPNITRTHVPNHSSHSHFYQSTTNPANYSAPVHHANGGQWNCVPHRRISPSDMSGSRNEMNQFHIGGGGGSGFNRHPTAASSQSFHGGPHAHAHAPPSMNHSRRVESSYGNGSRYSHYAHGGGTSSSTVLHAPPDNLSSRNSRHFSSGGWRSSYRSGRPRIAVERFQPVLDSTESHNRIEHEGTIMMVDRASFFGSSRNFSDQYRDLRLDIDNMSYEELLNLEERMGNVSTGLSEDHMSKCLREKVYCFSDQNQEEDVSCPICLEEYKNGDKVGKMEKCGHEYHVDCIKKWLLMKKLCPICKTECSNQEPSEA